MTLHVGTFSTCVQVTGNSVIQMEWPYQQLHANIIARKVGEGLINFCLVSQYPGVTTITDQQMLEGY